MRYLILFSAVMMQVCLGATYFWSVYVQPLRDLTGLAVLPGFTALVTRLSPNVPRPGGQVFLREVS